MIGANKNGRFNPLEAQRSMEHEKESRASMEKSLGRNSLLGAGKNIMGGNNTMAKNTIAPDSNREVQFPAISGRGGGANDFNQPQNNLFGAEDEFKFEGLEINDIDP